MIAVLHLGDCREVLPTLAAASVDSIVTDPPYELGFMGRAWDRTGVAFDAATWRETLRVLKPGGHLLAFGGTRTYHRLVCAVEDAGFEVRDQIAWVYGSGFPKSRAVLKPAHEPILLARRPGAGGLRIEACRVPATDKARFPVGEYGPRTGVAFAQDEWTKTAFHRTADPAPDGRWPANLIHDGSDEVLACFPQSPQRAVESKARNADGATTRGRGGEPSANSDNGGAVGFKMKPGARRFDSGSAARFFYCAKASKADRGEGNVHPTVKPLELMRYLCRLVTPPGGVVLDPFMGSGSTGRAAALEGFAFVGIERDPAYFAIAGARCA